LSATVRVAVAVVALTGVKLTWIVQLAPAATLAPQLFVWAKPVPPTKVMEAMLKAALPVLVRVTG
jgi:hypothetical protein